MEIAIGVFLGLAAWDIFKFWVYLSISLLTHSEKDEE